MKFPKLFITIVFVICAILLLIDLPGPITFQYWTPNIPALKLKGGTHSSTVNFSFIDIDTPLFQFKKDLSYKLGLDLQGGARIVYELDMSKIPQAEREAAYDSARNIIERRVNFFGVSEPLIQTVKIDNSYRVIVELPGISDVNEAINLIGRTAQLTFWEGSDTALLDAEATSSAYPLGMSQVFPGKKPIQTSLSGKDLKSAKVVFDPNTGAPQVQLDFTANGTKQFAAITKRNINKRVAIALDNELVEAPQVQSEIVNGNAVITGQFTPQTAKNLSIALNAGALPVPLKIIAQNTVGPSLGIESLRKSLVGGILGFVSIIIFMVFLYRKEGLLACIALLVYITITLFVFKLVPINLTLAGIAGFILSIGMAVDANILIFERMREELRAHKSKDIAVEVGFHRAWSSIRDSNISSIITSFILFIFGTGIIRGFALTLAIGIAISMFSAITVTRNLLRVFDKK